MGIARSTPVKPIWRSVDQQIRLGRSFMIASPWASAKVRFWSLNLERTCRTFTNSPCSNARHRRPGGGSDRQKPFRFQIRQSACYERYGFVPFSGDPMTLAAPIAEAQRILDVIH